MKVERNREGEQERERGKEKEILKGTSERKGEQISCREKYREMKLIFRMKNKSRSKRKVFDEFIQGATKMKAFI